MRQYKPLIGKSLGKLSFKKQLKAIYTGFTFKSFEKLKDILEISSDSELCDAIGINPRTLSRRKQANRFTKEESDRMMRVMRLFNLAEEVLDGKGNARSWMKSPQFGVDNMLPLSLLGTDFGCHEVETLLHQVEHGVYT